MLCLSFYEWRCIDAGEQMILAPFLGNISRDRAPGRFSDFLFAPKHDKADVLLTTNMGPVRCGEGGVPDSVLEQEVETMCRARDDEQPRIFLVEPIPHGLHGGLCVRHKGDNVTGAHLLNVLTEELVDVVGGFPLLWPHAGLDLNRIRGEEDDADDALQQSV